MEIKSVSNALIAPWLRWWAVGLAVLLLAAVRPGVSVGQELARQLVAARYPAGFLRCDLTVRLPTGEVDVQQVDLGAGACYDVDFTAAQIRQALGQVGGFASLREDLWTADLPIAELLQDNSLAAKLQQLEVALENDYRSSPADYPPLPALETLALYCDGRTLQEAGLLQLAARTPRLRQLELWGCHVTQAELRQLLQSSSIKSLSLRRCQLDKVALQAIDKAESLTELTISLDDLNAGQFDWGKASPRLNVVFDKPLASVKKLMGLHVRSVKFDFALQPDEVTQILGAIPAAELEEAVIERDVSKRMIEHLRRFPRLKAVELAGGFDADVLQGLRHITSLERLTVTGSSKAKPQLSLETLAALPKLQQLTLGEVAISGDADSAGDQPFPPLESLEFWSVDNAGALTTRMLAAGDQPQTLTVSPTDYQKLKAENGLPAAADANWGLRLLPEVEDFQTLEEIRAILDEEPSFRRLECVVDFLDLAELRKIAAAGRRSP